MKNYRHECPKCGTDVFSEAKHHARLQTPCLSCLRAASGWTCPGFTPDVWADDPAYYLKCPRCGLTETEHGSAS